MSAQALLNKLQQVGAIVTVQGGRLIIDAPAGAILPIGKRRIAEFKGGILALLAPKP